MPNLILRSLKKSVVIVPVLLTTGLAAWAVKQKVWTKQQSAINKSAVTYVAPSYDPALLQKFREVIKSLDLKDKPYTCTGQISMMDKADTAGAIKGFNFVFSRNGNNCYYRLQDVEMLNAEHVYLVVDHANKRVVVSAQKEIKMPVLGDGGKLAELLQSEDYQLKDKVEGRSETLTALNEHHLSCKEYAVTYDTVSHKINRIYTRLSDITDVTNKDKDRIIDLRISTLTEEAAVSSYLNVKKVLRQSGGQWKLQPAFSNYELIKI